MTGKMNTTHPDDWLPSKNEWAIDIMVLCLLQYLKIAIFRVHCNNVT